MKAFVRIHVSTAGSRVGGPAFDESPPVGYYQRLGVTAEDAADLQALVREHVATGTGGTLLDVDEIEVADLADRHRDLRERCRDATARGIWYESGRGFYSGEDDDADDSEDDEEPDDEAV